MKSRPPDRSMTERSRALFTRVRGRGVLGRWDEKADPPTRSTLWSATTIRALFLEAQRKEDRPMDDGSRRNPSMTLGIDLGDKYSHLCLLDTESGELIEEGRLRTTPEAFKQRFCFERPLCVAIEAGTHSPWVSRLLKECGHEVLVANPRKTRLIYGDKHKTDKLDAENLARLARVDPKLLHPLKHRGESSQAHLAILRSREALVGTRTQLINHLRGAVKSFGARLPKCSARSFHKKKKKKKMAEHLPKELLPALEPLYCRP